MKAIKTQYLCATNTRGSRYMATTGEKGQRVYLADWGCENADVAHAMAARMLCKRMGWDADLIGGGFPDGSMVWVWASSNDRTRKKYRVSVEARRVGALGVLDQHRDFCVDAISRHEARDMAIELASCQQLEHVTVKAAELLT